MAFPEAPTSTDFRESNPIVRHIVLFGVTVHERLTWSLRLEEWCPKDGIVGPLL